MGLYLGSSSVCGNSYTDAIVPVTIKVPHTEDKAKLRFTSTLDQAATDEAWGVKSVAVYTSSPSEHVAYSTNFDTVGDWKFSGATAKVTTCGDFNVLGGYGVLDTTDSVELYLQDMIAHSTMTIEFDFVKIDSWDNEWFYVYVDDNLEYSQQLGASDGTQMCGSTNNNWHEDFVPVSMTFKHHGQGVKVKVKSSLSSTATDESWGLANFKITTALDDCTEIVYESDFNNDHTDGWVIQNGAYNNITFCDDDAVLGGYHDFGKSATATKVVDLGSEGNGVVVAFTFLKLDSWDSEYARLYADDVLVWNEQMYASSGANLCGSSNTNWNEQKVMREIDLGWVNSDIVMLKWTTTLNSAASDESWGLIDVDVYTYSACDAVAFESDFRHDGDDGWMFVGSSGGTSSCNGEIILGGYNKLDYSDKAQRLFMLPLHTSMQVDFTFAKIDSWDSEYAYFSVDHSTKWSQKLAGGSANICGNSARTWTDANIEKTFTVEHYSPYTWLQWWSALSSGGTDESWGLLNVKITTFMRDDVIPVYQSRFHFEQLDGWEVTNLDASASGYFTDCDELTMLGGYSTFGKGATATREMTHLPPHTSATVAWTWVKLDSWDNEYFYMHADSTLQFSKQMAASYGDQICGRSNTNWDEGVLSEVKTFDHSSDSLTIKFSSNINSGATDESWGLIGVNVYVSSS